MVFDKVKAIIVDQLGVEEDAVKMEASFLDDLGSGLFGHRRAYYGSRGGIRYRNSGRRG